MTVFQKCIVFLDLSSLQTRTNLGSMSPTKLSGKHTELLALCRNDNNSYGPRQCICSVGRKTAARDKCTVNHLTGLLEQHVSKKHRRSQNLRQRRVICANASAHSYHRLLRHGDHRISNRTHRNTTNHTDSPEVHRVVMMTAHWQNDARRQITQMIISDYSRIL